MDMYSPKSMKYPSLQGEVFHCLNRTIRIDFANMNALTHPLNTSRNVILYNNRSTARIARELISLFCDCHSSPFRLSSLSHSKWHTTHRTLMRLRCCLHCSQTWFTELVFAWQLFRVCKVIETDRTPLGWIVIILIIRGRLS